MKADDLATLVGNELGASAWLEVTQERVNQFADATDDHQFIHVDPERAAATPFGGTIAHGYLSLSLLPALAADTTPRIDGLIMAINYGLDKVRFIQPVRAGSRVRSRQKVLQAVQRSPGRWMVKTEQTVDIEGEDKPALIAVTIALFIVNQ